MNLKQCRHHAEGTYAPFGGRELDRQSVNDQAKGPIEGFPYARSTAAHENKNHVGMAVSFHNLCVLGTKRLRNSNK